MTPDQGIPLGASFGEFDYPWVTVGTTSPGAAFTTPFYYNSAGTASYVWGGTSYVHIKAVA